MGLNKFITLEEENFYKELFEKIEKDLEKHSEWSRVPRPRLGSVDYDFILRSKENLEEKKINIRELLGELRSADDDYRLIFKIQDKFKCQIHFYKEKQKYHIFEHICFYAIYFDLYVLKLEIKKDWRKTVISKIEYKESGGSRIFILD